MDDPQPGGTGVPPVLSEKITRRHLPHWQIAGATYFLTWRCADGVTLSEAERDIVLAASATGMGFAGTCWPPS